MRARDLAEARKTWSPEEIQAVWNKGAVVTGIDEDAWRKDECTAWIHRTRYGSRDSDYGWEVHHVDGNPDNNNISNLRPLQWDNNASGECVVTSSGNKNVRRS